MNRSIGCRESLDGPRVAAGDDGRAGPLAPTGGGALRRAVRSVLRLHGYRNLRGRLLDDLLSGLEDRG
ncbi:MAG: hypothetical protein R3315_06975 [Woeseiaceae bacterium]|nr:hypothetical protein [Woeseiaceae bacterium]